MHPCPQCGKEFATIKKMAGHIGGAHGDLMWGRRTHDIEHGTNAGYMAHVRRGLKPIDRPCQVARAKYMQEWRAKRRAWGKR